MLRENPWFVRMFWLVTMIAFAALMLSLRNDRRIDDLYAGEDDTLRPAMLEIQEALINDVIPVMDSAGR